MINRKEHTRTTGEIGLNYKLSVFDVAIKFE